MCWSLCIHKVLNYFYHARRDLVECSHWCKNFSISRKVTVFIGSEVSFVILAAVFLQVCAWGCKTWELSSWTIWDSWREKIVSSWPWIRYNIHWNLSRKKMYMNLDLHLISSFSSINTMSVLLPFEYFSNKVAWHFNWSTCWIRPATWCL